VSRSARRTRWALGGLARSALSVLSALLGVCSVGCGAPPSRLAHPEVFRFGVSHMSGNRSLVIRADGAATLDERFGARPRLVGTVMLEPAELDELARVLRERGLCALSSSSRHGIPDEAAPVVRVRLGSLDCQVRRWDGDWQDDADARAALAAVEALASRVSARLSPP
jgi:hypothetical protein